MPGPACQSIRQARTTGLRWRRRSRRRRRRRQTSTLYHRRLACRHPTGWRTDIDCLRGWRRPRRDVGRPSTVQGGEKGRPCVVEESDKCPSTAAPQRGEGRLNVARRRDSCRLNVVQKSDKCLRTAVPEQGEGRLNVARRRDNGRPRIRVSEVDVASRLIASDSPTCGSPASSTSGQLRGRRSGPLRRASLRGRWSGGRPVRRATERDDGRTTSCARTRARSGPCMDRWRQLVGRRGSARWSTSRSTQQSRQCGRPWNRYGFCSSGGGVFGVSKRRQRPSRSDRYYYNFIMIIQRCRWCRTIRQCQSSTKRNRGRGGGWIGRFLI